MVRKEGCSWQGWDAKEVEERRRMRDERGDMRGEGQCTPPPLDNALTWMRW